MSAKSYSRLTSPTRFPSTCSSASRSASHRDRPGPGRDPKAPSRRQPLPGTPGVRALPDQGRQAWLCQRKPYLKRLWNQALLARIEVAGGRVVSVQLRPPFDAIFSWRGSNKGCLVGEAVGRGGGI